MNNICNHLFGWINFNALRIVCNNYFDVLCLLLIANSFIVRVVPYENNTNTKNLLDHLRIGSQTVLKLCTFENALFEKTKIKILNLCKK